MNSESIKMFKTQVDQITKNKGVLVVFFSSCLTEANFPRGMTNLKHYPDLGMEFLRSHLERQPVNEVSSILSYLYDLYLTIIPRVRVRYEMDISSHIQQARVE